MIKKLALASLLAVSALGFSGTQANAAHCLPAANSPEAGENFPGFSYFGRDHVKESTHPEGGNPGPHMGTSGASNCRKTTGSPSERAPGRQ